MKVSYSYDYPFSYPIYSVLKVYYENGLNDIKECDQRRDTLKDQAIQKFLWMGVPISLDQIIEVKKKVDKDFLECVLKIPVYNWQLWKKIVKMCDKGRSKKKIVEELTMWTLIRVLSK